MPKSNCRIASPSSLALALFKMTATYGPQQPVMPTPFIRSRVPSGNYVVAIRKAPRLFLSLSHIFSLLSLGFEIAAFRSCVLG